MKELKITIILLVLMFGMPAYAALMYVGDSPQCNQSNHYDTLDQALLAAIINGNEADEIRLTNTISYQGNNFGSYTISVPTAGHVTIAGGYGNCNDPQNTIGPTIGNTDNPVFEIKNNSLVSLRNLQISGSQSRGIIVDEAATVYLFSVDVSDNVAGIRVLGGAYVEVDNNSTVYGNGDLDDIPKGGGIWCFGNNSEVTIAGTIHNNQATSGGNMYIEDGCFITLEGGALIKGDRDGSFQYSAHYGGGIMVHNGGELLADGDENRVLITDHRAIYTGGGIYVFGTGRATLFNTYIAKNSAEESGTGLYAINGGSVSNQVVMDRAESCPFLISCSEFDDNIFWGSVIHVNNSKIKISRTLIENNDYQFTDNVVRGVISLFNGAYLQLTESSFTQNDAFYLIANNDSKAEMSHITAVGNTNSNSSNGNFIPFAWMHLGSDTFRVENSIFQNTQGGDDRSLGGLSGKCNLIDNNRDWPGGSYTTGTAQFNNVAGGDARQQSSSDGVDMCQQDTFAWSNNRDIEYQTTPVNENTNPQGMPGEAGGLFDAGFDEVYDNIGNDEFLLTVQKEGSGTGVVISDPLGISCGSDCTEVVFNGTLLELTATATGNSEFIGWSGCPLPSNNVCFITVTESTTVFAEFQPDDLIFKNGFED